MNKEKIMEIIYSAMDQVNAMLEDKDQLQKSPDTVIMGNGGKLDSLGLINFVVGLEQQFQQDAGIELSLADQMMNASDSGVFSTVDSLAAFIAESQGV